MKTNQREFIRIETDIHVCISHELFIYHGVIKDISCWGAKLSCKKSLEECGLINLNFIVKSQFNVAAEIVESMGNHLYRVKFYFENLRDRMRMDDEIKILKKCTAKLFEIKRVEF